MAKFCLCGCGTEVIRNYVRGHHMKAWMIPVERRFWPKVNKSGPITDERLGNCWTWTGNHNSAGYGMFYPGGGQHAHMLLAHRVSYEMEYGAIPAGLELDHLCRTTDCLRPSHLEPVTHQENITRGYRRKRERQGVSA